MRRGGGLIEYYSHKTLIHETTQQDINYILVDGCKFDDDRLPSNGNKPRSIGDTDWPIYKYGWKCNNIDHMMESV